MTIKHYIFALFGTSLSLAQAQSTSASDPNLINLQTPTVLHRGQSAAELDLRYFGGYDKTLHAGVGLGYGLGHGLEVDLAGSFSKWNSALPPSGNEVRFGGTDEELSLKYRLPKMKSLPISVQAGLEYVQTPAQPERLAGTLGASAGYSLDSKIRFYLNPKVVFLDHNTLVGLGLGASVDLVSKLTLVADWTPMLAGENTIDTQTGGRTRSQLYSVGLRYGMTHKCNIDLGVTNASGITSGSSLTPSLGDSPALFVRLTHHF
jgi:hypothetical protein